MDGSLYTCGVIYVEALTSANILVYIFCQCPGSQRESPIPSESHWIPEQEEMSYFTTYATGDVRPLVPCPARNDREF
jgi:hypothetical protein